MMDRIDDSEIELYQGSLMYYSAKNDVKGAEFKWGNRENYTYGYSTSIFKKQFSFKYNLSE